MIILAIDTSGPVAGVALLKDGVLIGEYNVENEKKHSVTMMPMMEALFPAAGISVNDIDGVAVSCGPGSFTGIRIGIAAAKGIAYAVNKPVAAVPTLEMLAWNFWGNTSVICPMMDARRQQVYNGLYEFENGSLKVIKDSRALPVTDVITELNEAGKPVVFLGDGVPVYRDIIEENIRVEHSFAPPHLNHQKASSLAALGTEFFKAGRVVSAEELVPEYLRKSQAEQEKERALAGSVTE